MASTSGINIMKEESRMDKEQLEMIHAVQELEQVGYPWVTAKALAKKYL